MHQEEKEKKEEKKKKRAKEPGMALGKQIKTHASLASPTKREEPERGKKKGGA